MTIGSFLIMTSCVQTSTLVSTSNISNLQIRYFKLDNTKPNSKKTTFYARTDSSGIQTYYSFFSTDIYKTSSGQHKSVYKLIYTDNPSIKLSSLDSIVLDKATFILDSLKDSNLARPRNATGFIISDK